VPDAALRHRGGRQHPTIVSWRKLDLEEPLWFVKVSGGKGEVRIERVDDLTNCRRFCDQCVKQQNLFFTPMKPAEWAAHLREKAPELVVEKAPEDTTESGIFHEALEEFLTNRQRGENREDILSRRPWEDREECRHYFRMQDLMRHLEREGLRLPRHRCATLIKRLGGGANGPTTIKGRSVRLWWVPSEALHETPPADLPERSMEL
jgi:hypothetical protein